MYHLAINCYTYCCCRFKVGVLDQPFFREKRLDRQLERWFKIVPKYWAPNCVLGTVQNAFHALSHLILTLVIQLSAPCYRQTELRYTPNYWELSDSIAHSRRGQKPPFPDGGNLRRVARELRSLYFEGQTVRARSEFNWQFVSLREKSRVRPHGVHISVVFSALQRRNCFYREWGRRSFRVEKWTVTTRAKKTVTSEKKGFSCLSIIFSVPF